MIRKSLILILTLIILVTSTPFTADASSGLVSDVKLSGYGGGSGASGSVGAGQWNENMQGIRITVVNHFGEPAFEFRGRDSLDIIFGTDRLGTVTHYMDGSKISHSSYASPSLDGLNTYVITLDNLQNMINSRRYSTVVHSNAEAGLESKLNKLPKPLESKVEWEANGTKIYRFLNGGDELGNMDVDAQLRTILNIYTLSNREADYLWKPKELITTSSTGYIDTSYFSPIHGGNVIDPNTRSAKDLNDRKKALLGLHQELNQLSGSGGLTNDLAERFILDPKEDENKLTAMTPFKLIEELNYAVIVEPIIWNRIRKNYNTNDDWTNYVVYGTQTNVAVFIDAFERAGYLPARTGGWQYGGSDTALFGRVGRKSMFLMNDIVYPALLVDRAGKLEVELKVLLNEPPKNKQKVVSNGSLSVTNREMADRTGGWGMHIFYGGKIEGDPFITTTDTPENGREHPAPDPSTIPPGDGEDITKRVANIVKTYEDGTTHVATYKRTNTPKKIIIQDELEYKVEEWAISTDYLDPEESTTWDEIINNIHTKETGNSPGTVLVEEPDTTLYVKLVKKITGGGISSLEISQSQITRAVDTIDTNVPGWGPRTMNFQYQNLSGTCPVIEYCGGCRGNSEDGYWCPGHRCNNTYILNDVNFNYFFKNTEAIKNKLQANVGIFEALNTKDDKDSKGNRSNINAGTDSINSFNYQLVLWRGKDKPTLASYKVASGHELNTLLNKYGKQPIGTRLKSDYIEMLNIKLDKDDGHSKSDYRTNSKCTKHGVRLRSTAENTNTLDYNADVKVKVYPGVQHQKGDKTSTNSANLLANLVGKPVNTKFSGGTAVNASTELKFYPYIRMTYQKPAMAFNDRIDINVLSEWVSELHPHSYAEASWGSTKDINMNISSVQWSTHKRAVEGTDGWQGRNKVLPGGAVFTLDTKNQNTYASVITWQPYLENEIANNVIISGAGSYKLADTVQPHEDLANSAKKALDNWRVVQYVEKNTNASDAFGGLKITGGGKSLTSLGLSTKTSTEAKYWLKPDGQGEISGQGDLDIINTTVTDIHYKVKADTEGKVYVQRKRDGSSWVTIDTIEKNQKVTDLPSILSNESKQLNERTQIITNILTVLTRNAGDDKTASWATTDGKWYNEAFDGINYIRKETCFEVGFVQSALRSAAIDPRITPPNTGQGYLFSTAFISQFRMNDKSDEYPSEVPGYVGKFKGQVVRLTGADNMYKTRVFSLPNANVQDLK